MLSLRTASPTKVPGQTASNSFCLLTSCPGCSSNSFKTAKAFGRRGIERASCHRHSFARSSRNFPKAIPFAPWIVHHHYNNTFPFDWPGEFSCHHLQNVVMAPISKSRTSPRLLSRGDEGKRKIQPFIIPPQRYRTLAFWTGLPLHRWVRLRVAIRSNVVSMSRVRHSGPQT
jgi:hypothetical protein